MLHGTHRLAILATLLAAPALAGAQDTTTVRDSLAARVERLTRQVDSLRRVAERQDERLMELDERAAAGAPAPAVGQDTAGRRSLGSSRGIYGKPFVRRFGTGTAVGGYVDLEYNQSLDGHTSSFDQHRLVPFIFAEITDNLHFGTEIEFEHGPSVEVEDGEAAGAGEINVEFATVDYGVHEAFNLRGGIVLAPLGRFNLVHDSPVNDLTDRPLVDRDIIPTTLSEAGFGVFGTLYPTSRSLLSYELYLVNGFTAEVLDGGQLRVRDGRGLRGEDNNFAKSVVGRLAFSPMLGLELGASAHTGRYAADGDGAGGGDLTIWALDATFQRGPLELLGEYGRVQADLPEPPPGAPSISDSQDGYYVQGNWHFGHGWVAPRATSVFTGVARWDRVDFSRGLDGDTRERLTLGLNWRPVEDAVFKADYQWNWTTPLGDTDRGALERRLLLSLATYF